MEIGIFGVGQLHRDPVNDVMPTENDMFHELVRRAVHAEQVGLDVYAIGEHHNPPFISSADTTMLAYIAAKTNSITLSTSTTLITTNDPVRIAEEFATLQHLSNGRVDLMLGRGNTAEVYPWFGRDIRDGIHSRSRTTRCSDGCGMRTSSTGRASSGCRWPGSPRCRAR
jgi:alkanesulfonate monooxygenase SsuD/methylene tetrahydromethanopterin reductase-like flavin-dependent oxidoreductase (luciferase family)